MKKQIFLLIAIVASIEIIQAGVQGALPGAFSVSATKKVYFSQGNLQYQASTKTWRFAANQYTYIGSANKNISSTYSGWIDLFGYGTGDRPTETRANQFYVPFPVADWGKNPISNGGSKSSLWRTLTKDEWIYILHGRTNYTNLFGLGKVNGVPGAIILPDNWKTPSGVSFTPSTSNGLYWYNSTYYKDSSGDHYSDNTYTTAQWQLMEAAGAVFFPAAGRRGGVGVDNVGINGYVWSLTMYSLSLSNAYGIFLEFRKDYLNPQAEGQQLYLGRSVRLVIDSDKNVAYTITWKNWDGTTLATTSVLKGATPSYTGSTPTRPSTAEYAYTFSGWTPAITAATANKTYTATYTSTPRYTITFNANGGLIPTNGNMGNTPSGHITTLSADRTSGTVVVTKDKTHFQTMINDCPSREGYTFAGWYTDPTSGVQVYDNTGYRVVGTYWNSEGKWIGTSNVTLYAHWTPIPYTITVNSSNVSQGTAAGGGTYDYGTNHQITATPNECYRFVQWSDGNTDNPRTITVTGDATYTAEFEQIQYTIEALPDNPAQGSTIVE